MDSQLLEELLDPNQTYDDVSLPVFVRKVGENFEGMKERGDTFLDVESGHCCDLGCNPNLIRTAYRFVGNHTRHYMDLRFILEFSEDGKYYIIKDIFECNSFRSMQKKEWYGVQLIFIFYDDEKPGYKLTPDELLHTEIALKAEKEITSNKEVFHLEEVETWMQRYLSTFGFIMEKTLLYPDRKLRWNSFFHLYEGFEDCMSFFEKWSKSLLVQASQEDLELEEDVLIEVILEAEKILKDEGHEYTLYVLQKEESYRIRYWLRYLIGGIADTFSTSWVWFKAQQQPLLRKFYALTEPETVQFLNSWGDVDPESSIRSLTFHLDIRRKAEERGELIPFGLGEDNLDQIC